MKKNYTRLFYTSIFILLIMLALRLSLSFLINTEFVKTRLSEKIAAETGIEFTEHRIDIAFYPHFTFTFGDIDIKTAHPEQFHCRIRKAVLYPDLLLLLKGSLTVKKIHLSDITPAFSLPENKTPIYTAFSFLPDTVTENLLSFFPEKGGKIYLKNLHHQFFKTADISMSVLPESESIKGDITIRSFFLKKEGVKSSRRLNKTFVSDEISIQFDLNTKGIGTAVLQFSDAGVKTGEKETILFSKKINATLHTSEKTIQLNIPPSSFEIPSMKSGVRFSYDRRNKRGTITFAAENADIEALKVKSGKLFKENNISRNLFDILREGNVRSVVVGFNNNRIENLFNPDNMTIKGNIDTGVVKIPGTALMTRQTAGSALFENGILKIAVSEGIIKNSSIKTGRLNISVSGEKIFPFHGTFEISARLGDVRHVLMELLPESVLSDELNRVKHIDGTATGVLVIEQNSAGEIEVDVIAKEVTGTGSYSRLFGNLDIDAMQFELHNKTVEVKNCSGKIGNSAFKNIHAVVDLKEEQPWMLKSGKAVLVLSDIYPWLLSFKQFRSKLPRLDIVDGLALFQSMRAAGPLRDIGKWHYNLTGRCKEIIIKNRDASEEMLSLSCRFNISEKTKILKRIKGEVKHTGLFSSMAAMPYLQNLKTPFLFKNGVFSLSPHKAALLEGSILFRNGPELTFSAGKEKNEKFFINHLKLSDGQITRAAFVPDQNGGINFLDFTGYIHSETIEKIFKTDCPIVQGPSGLTGGNSFLLTSEPGVSPTILARHLDLNLLAENMACPTAFVPKAAAKKAFTIKADAVHYNRLTVKDLEALISLEEKTIAVNIVGASLCRDIQISGKAVKQNAQIQLNINLNSDNQADLSGTVFCLFKKERLIDGNYDFTCRLSASSPVEHVNKNVNGTFQFNGFNGRIYRLTLLSRILSVINIAKIIKGRLPDIRQNGFAFNSFSITATIEKSRIFIEKAVIDGHDMMLVFRGWINPNTDEIDLTCLIAPFKTVDLVIEKLPLINTILKGRLISIPVKATGSMSDPSVIPLHPSAVGEGAVNIMKSILQTPVRILEKIP